MLSWMSRYFTTLYNLQLAISVNDRHSNLLTLDEGVQRYIHCAKFSRQNSNKLIFIGNGGSAGIASHLAIDYSKNGNTPAVTFTDASAITCLGNDYGYEFVFSKQIEFHAKAGDMLIAISSSGRSLNILNAVSAARKVGCRVITFSGFDPENPLRILGDINFYVASKEYGFVEVSHMTLGHAILDCLIEEQCKEKNRQAQLALAELD